jgi:hypothetical protein
MGTSLSVELSPRIFILSPLASRQTASHWALSLAQPAARISAKAKMQKYFMTIPPNGHFPGRSIPIGGFGGNEKAAFLDGENS